jgi:hypothetical protein
MPGAVDAVHVLALQTRVRAARVAGGEISAARLYDVRAFKSVIAELGYLRTLTRKRTGGTIVTSMPQLVKGLARLHPAWKIEGDKFADRDRHHNAVRRRLRDLDAMGLLRWRIGVDVDGEDARTELELRPAPDLIDDELTAAAAQLKRWQKRYGAALNTGSRTGVRNAAGHARPLSASERQRRGITRTRQRAKHAHQSSTSNSAPRFATPTTSENPLIASPNHSELHDVCGARTGVRARKDHTNGLWVSRPQPHNSATVAPAISVIAETTSLRIGGSGRAGGPESVSWDESALLERVAVRLADRQAVWDLIAVQAQRRATDVASWGLARGWPAGRLREAWVLWRYGSRCAAELGAAPAGPLQADDLQRLRRAVARYERHAQCAPRGWPARGLAALAAIGALADQRDARPQTLHYAIRAVDQLSRRMRANATANDPQRRDRGAARAQRRHPAAAGPIGFRLAAWPPWVALDDNGDPILDGGELVLAVKNAIHRAPDREDPHYQQILRDAQLLAGLWPHTDGRTAMATDHDYDHQTARRHARPGPYPRPHDRHAQPEPADVRLAKLTALPLRIVQHLDSDQRDELLEHYRAHRAQQRTTERDALCARLADVGNDDTQSNDDA